MSDTPRTDKELAWRDGECVTDALTRHANFARQLEREIVRLSAEREDLITRQKIASDLLEYDRKEIFLMKDALAERDNQLAEVKAEVEHLESAFDGRSEELSKMTADRDTFHDECIRLRRHIKNTEEEIEAKRQYVKECNHLPELVIGSEDGYICCECWAIEQEKRADELTAQLLAAQTELASIPARVESDEIVCDRCGESCGRVNLPVPRTSTSPDPTLLDEVKREKEDALKLCDELLEMVEEYHNCKWEDEPFTPDIDGLAKRISRLRQSTRETEEKV